MLVKRHSQEIEESAGVLGEDPKFAVAMLGFALRKPGRPDAKSRDLQEELTKMQGELDEVRRDARIWRSCHEDSHEIIRSLRSEKQSANCQHATAAHECYLAKKDKEVLEARVAELESKLQEAQAAGEPAGKVKRPSAARRRAQKLRKSQAQATADLSSVQT